LPIRRAEELIATLPGVLSVRIVPNETGAVDEIHVLTTDLVAPKNTVRNIESALMAQLGLRVNHRKVSVATTLDAPRATDGVPTPVPMPGLSAMPGGGAPLSPPMATPLATPMSGVVPGPVPGPVPGTMGSFQTPYAAMPPVSQQPSPSAPYGFAAMETPTSSASSGPRARPELVAGRRLLIFEDVEVRRSRVRGVTCRVTLSRDGVEYFGESEGQETEKARIDLAARATLQAIASATRSTPGGERSLALEGAKRIEAFDREFVFVSLVARMGREPVVLTGSCEVRESAETSAVLAVLDATNRWIQIDR